MAGGSGGRSEQWPGHPNSRPPQFLALFYCSVQLCYVAAAHGPMPRPLQGQLPLPGSHFGVRPCLSRVLLHHGELLLGAPCSTKGCGLPSTATTPSTVSHSLASICQLMSLLPGVSRDGGIGLPRYPGWD